MDTLKCALQQLLFYRNRRQLVVYLQVEFGPSQLVATRIKTANGSLFFKQIIVIILYLINRLIVAATMDDVDLNNAYTKCNK